MAQGSADSAWTKSYSQGASWRDPPPPPRGHKCSGLGFSQFGPPRNVGRASPLQLAGGLCIPRENRLHQLHRLLSERDNKETSLVHYTYGPTTKFWLVPGS